MYFFKPSLILSFSCKLLIQSEDQIAIQRCFLDSGVCIVCILGRKKCPSEEVYSRPSGPWIGAVDVDLDPEDKCEIGYKTRTNQISNQLDTGKTRSGFVV